MLQLLAFVTVVSATLVGCKGKAADKADPPAPAPTTPAAPTKTDNVDPPAAEPAEPAAPPVPDAKPCPEYVPYKSGSVKLTATGAESATLDFVEVNGTSSGTALDEGGISVGFRTASGNDRIAFHLPCTASKLTQGLGNAQFLGGVYIVGDCTFDVTKLDKTGVEGSFDCPKQANMNKRDKILQLKATFSLSAK